MKTSERIPPAVGARWLLAAACLVTVLAVSCLVARAEDSDRLRYYLGLRGQDTNPATGIHDAWGFSLGGNLNRYVGVELSGDVYEHFIEYQSQTVGELGTFALIPQLRLRYPLFGDRLVPYAVGGVGVALNQFNDRKPPGFGLGIGPKSFTALTASLGAGLEYFFDDNLTLGFELKYLFAQDQAVLINGQRASQEIGGLLTMLTMRFLGPELRPQPLAEAREHAPARVYLAFRAGAASSASNDVFARNDIKPEPGAYFQSGNAFYGFGLGLNLGRHVGMEVAAEGYEVRLKASGLGSIGEMAVTDVIPQLRLRYPLREGRVLPYLIGGVGVSHAEFNDRKPPGAGLNVNGNSFGVGAAVGAGVDYFIASNIAFGLETRYLTARAHTLKVDGGPQQEGSFNAIVVAAVLRIFVYDFGKRAP